MGYHVKEILPYPPEGYEFITREGVDADVIEQVSRRQLAQRIVEQLFEMVPAVLLKSRYDRMMKKPPPDSDLTFSLNHLVFRDEPWVIEVGRIWELVGFNINHFFRYKKTVEKSLGSDNCKRILCWTQFSRQTCLDVLDCADWEDKIDFVPRAVYAKDFTKEHDDAVVRFLFVGSANQAGQFEYRGGKEILEAFDVLCKRYDNLELIIRSDISDSIKKRYSRQLANPRVKLVDGFLPWQEVENLYKTSDIFFFPCHYESWQITLEAMSYELPVITVDLEGVSEFVKDGETGFLVPETQNITRTAKGVPLPPVSPLIRKQLMTTDPVLVDNLVEKASIMVENLDLRRKMGKAGRERVESGDNSIAARNAKLKEVFDRALA